MYLHSSDNRPQLMFVRDAVVYKQFIEDKIISNGISLLLGAIVLIGMKYEL